jgi:hypothetical protein
MSVPIKGSFVGRFALKFVEVLGAGIATAVGSYFVAQLSGYWSAPAPAHAPATVQIAPSNLSAPNASVVSKAPRVDADGSKLAPDAPAPAAGAARTTATANPAASRKRAPAEANAEAKPPEKEPKPQDKETAEIKARDKDDKDSVEAQVRAALANVDASRQPAPAAQMAAPAAVPKTEPPPNTGAVAAVPRGADVAAPPAQPGPSPASAEPLTPVEIKSHPIADVDAAAQAQADAGARAEASQANDKGLFGALKKIPEFFRTDAHPPDDPPRPPKQVGE